jgi:predicted AlkP superfamily pyrophosphatase or phosphodiesterase
MPLSRRSLTTLALVAALSLTIAPGTAASPLTERFVPEDASTASEVAERAASPRITRVMVVSIDGLNPSAIKRLGPRRTPTLHRLMKQGASTLNARTEYERTETLPNHVGMVTGLRVSATGGGHGVTWNDSRLDPNTVQEAAGRPVTSVFSTVHAAGGSSAVFVCKEKLSLFDRSWGAAVNRMVVNSGNERVVTLSRRDLLSRNRMLTFVHLSRPDSVGHAKGYMTSAYLKAVAATDRSLGRLVRAITQHRALRRHLALIVVTDHGGRGKRHDAAAKLVNYRIPFFVWGPGVAAGADLYDLNPDYQHPGRTRPSYAAARQPIRNGAVANLAADLLGLPALTGSEFDAAQDLDVR